VNRASAVQKFPARVLRWFVPRLAPDMRPWGEAMLTELVAVRGRMDSLVWALGGATVMMRLLVRQWIRSGALRSNAADPLAAGGRPPRRWTGIAMAALAVSLLFVPGFRQALRVAYAWHLISPSRFGQSSYFDMTEVAARGERQNDPILLAFAALRTFDPEKRARWAGRAVAMDPTLTWIRMPLAYADMWDSLTRVTRAGGQPPRVTTLIAPPFAEMQARDPKNGFPYLLEVDWMAFEATNRRVPMGISGEQAAKLQDDPRWQMLAEKAYRSPVWDDYSGRMFELTQEALLRLGWSQPLVLATAVRPNVLPWLQTQVNTASNRPAAQRWHISGIGSRTQDLWKQTWWRSAAVTNNGTYIWLASVVMVTSAVAALCAAALLLGWLAELLALWRKRTRLRHAAQWMQRCSAPLLLGACTLMSLCYRPFADVYSRSLHAGGDFDPEPLLIAYSSFSVALNRLTFAGAEEQFYFWCASLVALTVLLAWRVRRMAHA